MVQRQSLSKQLGIERYSSRILSSPERSIGQWSIYNSKHKTVSAGQRSYSALAAEADGEVHRTSCSAVVLC